MGPNEQYVSDQVKLLPRADLEALAMNSMIMGAEVLQMVQNAQAFGDEITEDLIEYYEYRELL